MKIARYDLAPGELTSSIVRLAPSRGTGIENIAGFQDIARRVQRSRNCEVIAFLVTPGESDVCAANGGLQFCSPQTIGA